MALDKTRKLAWRVYHSHLKGLTWACSYCWWMSWLYRLLGGGWRGSAEKNLEIVVGHTPLCQHHPAPTAADTVFHKQEDGLTVSCVASPGALALLEYCSQCRGLHLGEDVEKMREANRDLKNRSQEERWEGVGCLVWREGKGLAWGFAVSGRLLQGERYETSVPRSGGVRANSNGFEWYHKRKKLLRVGMVNCWRRLLGRFGRVWHLCGWGFVLGRPNVCVRGELGAPGSRVPNPVGFCLQKLWGYWFRQGSGRKEVGGVALETLGWRRWVLASRACPRRWGKSWSALWEGGNQSESLVFDFLIHSLWEIRNRRSRWAHSWCSRLWLLKLCWTLRIHSWQMLKGCKLLYSAFSRSMLHGKRSDF